MLTMTVIMYCYPLHLKPWGSFGIICRKQRKDCWVDSHMKSIFEVYWVIKAASRTAGEKPGRPGWCVWLMKRIFCSEMVRGSLGKTQPFCVFFRPISSFCSDLQSSCLFLSCPCSLRPLSRIVFSSNLPHCHCHIWLIESQVHHSNKSTFFRFCFSFKVAVSDKTPSVGLRWKKTEQKQTKTAYVYVFLLDQGNTIECIFVFCYNLEEHNIMKKISFSAISFL